MALILGWGLGNLYVVRTRDAGRALERPLRRLLLPVYLLSPPGVLFLAWATASEEWQIGVPLAPVLASGIFVLLFLVPVSFARSAGRKR